MNKLGQVGFFIMTLGLIGIMVGGFIALSEIKDLVYIVTLTPAQSLGLLLMAFSAVAMGGGFLVAMVGAMKEATEVTE